jgi:hypothetical protein
VFIKNEPSPSSQPSPCIVESNVHWKRVDQFVTFVNGFLHWKDLIKAIVRHAVHYNKKTYNNITCKSLE